MAGSEHCSSTENEPTGAAVQTAAIVAVGTELLGDDRLDTNSLKITGLLQSYGVEVVFKAVVGDAEERLRRVLVRASEEADLVVVTGGLGPTRDDLTRAAAAALTGSRLSRDEEVLAWIEAMYARRGAEMPASNRRQAEVLDGSTVLMNDRGTAPGLQFEHQGTNFFLLPGVPYEMEGLLDSALLPFLAARNLATSVGEGELRVACLPESLVEERLAPLYDAYGSQDVTILAKPSEVLVRVRSQDSTVRAQMADMVVACLGDAVFSRAEATSASCTLEKTVLTALQSHHSTLSTAESCTGGLIGQRLTAVPGSSVAYLGGAISYSNAMKTSLLGVEASLIERHGAVSMEVAEAMAQGARCRFASDWAISVTGIAGPSGGTSEKPVGTVWLALAGPSVVNAHCLVFPGNRERVRLQASQYALDMVRRAVNDLEPLLESPWTVQTPRTEGNRTL